MLNQTAEQMLAKYIHNFSLASNRLDVKKLFSLTPPQETRLRQAILHGTEFLSMINCADVDQITGQVVRTGVSQLYTGRKKDARFSRKIGIEGNEYKLTKTDSCAVLTWDLLSQWGNSGTENEFFALVQTFIEQSFGLDMLRIGFNGTHIADETDPDHYPNGEDVNIGWHQIAKNWNGGSLVLQDQVTLGAGGDYATLDAIASDLKNSIRPEFRNDPRLVVLVGSDLVAYESFRLYQQADKPTEKIAAQLLSDSIAGMPAYIPPFMPGKRMVVTTLQNLHIYTQRNTRRRAAEDVQDREAFESKYWRMEGYALEIPELYAAVDENALSIVGKKNTENQ